MRAVLPGKPESRLQALATGYWDSRRIIAYITGNAFSILSDANTLLQTVYDDDDTPLQALAVDEASGKIAVCTHSVVRIYKPFGLQEDALKWALQSSFEIQIQQPAKPDAAAISLSWGSSEELLVGHQSLELYQTSSTPTCTWRKRLANPVRTAILSYDSAYIASVGSYDRLVKVWRRLSFGSDDVRFDFLYLSHPAPVTGIQWRRPRHVEQTMENVLYTFCADNVLRVWTASDMHGQQPPRLWGKIELGTSIQGQVAGDASLRWACIVHGRDFSAATEQAVQESDCRKSGDGDGDANADGMATLEHLIAVANRSPEVCLVFDGRGRMSAWALENVGSKSPPCIFNIAHIASDDFDFGAATATATATATAAPPDTHVELYSYCNTGGHLHVLLHSFDGAVQVYECNVARLLDPASKIKNGRLALRRTWTGHSAPVRKIVRNFSGRTIVSRTAQGQSVVWQHALDNNTHRSTPMLSRQAVIVREGHIHRMCLLRRGHFVVFLGHDTLSVWDCRPSTPVPLAETDYAVSGKPLCLLVLPRQRSKDSKESTTAHIATITSEKQGIVWAVRLPGEGQSGESAQGGAVREFVRFKLSDAGNDLAYVLPVDPAGSSPFISGFLDVFARDVAISYTHSGRVEFWTARVDEQRGRVDWLSTSATETGVASPALVSGSTMKKAALVNAGRSALTVWDVRGAQLEFAQEFENQHPIQDLDWTSTPDAQSILAVGFPHRVLLLCQMRFDYLNKGPAWAPVREIAIRDFTPHPIGDSTWLGDGHLVIGAGNQLFVEDRRFDASSSLVASLRLPHRKDDSAAGGGGTSWDLFEAVQRLNGPLPVFHPQFLSQCMLAGKLALVRRVLLALDKTLRYLVEGESVDDYLGMAVEEFYEGVRDTSTGAAAAASWSSPENDAHHETEAFTEDVAATIIEKLTRVGIPQLSGHEQIQLADMVECAGLVEKQRRSLDDNGARFMLFFRQHALRKGRTSEMHMSWREISWAYHSTSQDVLADLVTRHQHHGAPLWDHARESGLFMWLTDPAAVRQHFETVARNEYARGDGSSGSSSGGGGGLRNPVDCSLFYLALRKKTVLLGLWRMASWNREQAATVRLLANNFEDPKWRTVALKNAYALMSKRRFAYAAAFFLLADHLQDAVNVCLNQLKDLQLGIAIARVYEGDQGPVLQRLLEEEVLGIAAQQGNRWLASWAFWMLRRRDMAVRALITPVYNFLETPGTSGINNNPPDLQSRLFLTDDPALVILYAQLRQKSLQTLRGASKVTPRVEWDFVLHNARLYDRMGCDLLGLDLVRNWEFLGSPTGGSSAVAASTAGPLLGGDIDPLRLLRRRSSLVVDDLPVSLVAPVAAMGGGGGVPSEMKAGSGGFRDRDRDRDSVQPPPPTVFEEPDANSLLDSFGF